MVDPDPPSPLALSPRALSLASPPHPPSPRACLHTHDPPFPPRPHRARSANPWKAANTNALRGRRWSLESRATLTLHTPLPSSLLCKTHKILSMSLPISLRMRRYSFASLSIAMVIAYAALTFLALTRAPADTHTSRVLRSAEEVQLCLFSDRYAAAYSTIRSVCSNTQSSLRFILVVPKSGQLIKSIDKLVHACPRATIDVSTIEELTDRIISLGMMPVWKMPFQDSTPSSWTVRLADWDYSPKHISPFNHVRFYIPHIEPFKSLDRILFLDDDVIIQGDVKDAWNYQLAEGKAIAASCHNWLWSRCDEWLSSFNATYLSTPYLGWGEIDEFRSLEDATCHSSNPKEEAQCMPPQLLGLIANFSRSAFGEEFEVNLQTLNKNKAWNFGFNVFELSSWRDMKITLKYQAWMQFNLDHNIWASTSLAFGLGIPFLAFMNTMECLDEQLPVIQGLGFVPQHTLTRNGFHPELLPRLFGLHFNGDEKPWDPRSSLPEYRHLYLPYATPEVKESLEVSKPTTSASSFILLTEHEQQSDWFMDLTLQHKQLCVSGGWHRYTLAPFHDIYGDPDTETNAYPRPCGGSSMCTWSIVSADAVSALFEGWCVGANTGAKISAERMRPDLAPLCNMLNTILSNEELISAKRDTTFGEIQKLMPKVWSAYYRYVMQNQLFLKNKLQFTDEEKDPMADMLSCKCGSQATVVGMQVMAHWVSENDDLQRLPTWNSSRIPYYFKHSIFGEAQKLGTKVIYVRSGDLLRPYVKSEMERAVRSCMNSWGESAAADSLCRAAQQRVVLDVDEVVQQLSGKFQDRSRLLSQIQARNLDLLEVDYDDCVKDPNNCLKVVTDFMGLQPSQVSKQPDLDQIRPQDRSLADLVKNKEQLRSALAAHNMLSLWTNK